MITLIAVSRLIAVESKLRNQKKETPMNPPTQFKKISILPLLTALLVALVTFAPRPALATPSCGLTSTNLLSPVAFGYYPSGSLDLMCKQIGWRLKTKVKGDSDLYITQNTIQPGGQSGWHTHPGPSLVTVTEGTVTVYHDDCTFETYTVGQTFTDLGCGDVHNVRNETGVQAKTVAAQIVPHGAIRREDRPDPGCPQVPPCP
jgi:quercetin dioxygenase-like cupin family protein